MKPLNLKKRILVLGGTGFLGSHLVTILQEQKRTVTVFSGDINDQKTLAPAVKNADIIVNLVGTFDKEKYYLLNVLSCANLLNVCKDVKQIEKIIFASSQAVYGDYHGRPHAEKDKPRPSTEYGLSKYLAEQIYEFYAKTYDLPVVMLRFSNIYGPGPSMGVVSKYVNALAQNQPVVLYNKGKQKRDFLYVQDAVDAIIKAIDYKAKGNTVLNISGVKAYSLKEVVFAIEQNVGHKIAIEHKTSHHQDILHMESNSKKAKIILGWQAKVNLPEGIAKTIADKQNIHAKK